MELTNRRFAIFLTSGLTLAVLVGLLVWKVSDAGVTLNSQETEFAGQPVAATDATAQQRTADEPTSSEMSSSETTDGSASAGMDASTGAGNGNGGGNVAGPVKDPLAPPNANLNGNRGESAEPSYYRPTNAAPAPAPAQPQQQQQQPQQQQQQQQSVRTSASAPQRTPDSAASSTPQGEAPEATTPSGSTTVVPNEPSEPKRPSEPAEPGVQEGAHPPAVDAELQSGNDTIEIAPSDARAAAEALGVAPAADEKQDAPKKRPEDPFSASTRVQQAPAPEDAKDEVSETAEGAALPPKSDAQANSAETNSAEK